MSSLKSSEKVIFEKIFDRGGYVLNFSDATFSEFFRENGVIIDNPKYTIHGTSKMKRLRAFWEIESDEIVGKVLFELLNYACVIEKVSEENKNSAIAIINRLLGKSIDPIQPLREEHDFLNEKIEQINIDKLSLDTQLMIVINQRLAEIQKTLKSGAALATIFLCGSTMEGLLLDLASKNYEIFCRSSSSPKDKEGKVKVIHDWTLDNFINVAFDVGFLSLDIKKYGHSLRDFRNFIHPREQAVQKFNPDMHTARISWQVLKAAIADLSGDRK